jgi:hypothetical protein
VTPIADDDRQLLRTESDPGLMLMQGNRASSSS